jgi:hypothetical protein
MNNGAYVYNVRLPNFIPGGKTGLDDFLGIAGPSAFKGLCDTSIRFETGSSSKTTQIEQLSDIQPKPVRWLWKLYLAFGMLAMLSGDPDGGKTFIALAIAAAFSRGKVPYSGERCNPITTLYMSIENAAEYVTRPRFDALGGDPKRFFILKGTLTLQDVDHIRAALIQTGAELLIIDPLQSYLGAQVDSHRSNETRPVMDGLIRLAEELGICILIIRHLAKASGGRAIHRGLGSIDLTGAVRMEMLAGSAPDDPQVRALVQIKNNVGPRAQSLRYEIAGKEKDAKLIWRGTSDLTSADLLAPEGSKKRKTQIDYAKEYLRTELAKGPQLVNDLEKRGEFPLHVLQKARTELGLALTRKGEGGPWVWGLPKFVSKKGRGDE